MSTVQVTEERMETIIEDVMKVTRDDAFEEDAKKKAIKSILVDHFNLTIV